MACTPQSGREAYFSIAPSNIENSSSLNLDRLGPTLIFSICLDKTFRNLSAWLRRGQKV